MENPVNYPLPASPTPRLDKIDQKIRDSLTENLFTRTASKCFREPVKNRRRVFQADEFPTNSPKQTDEINLKISPETICKTQNLPLSRQPEDSFLAKYGPYRFEKCEQSELPSKYDYYNRTVGDTIRGLKERNAHLEKISNWRQFLRNKAESDELPELDAKFAYGRDLENKTAGLENTENIPVRELPFERFELSKKDSLTWLNRAINGSLPSRPIERNVRRICAGDDLSKILIKQETLDFNREKGTKRYRGKVVAPKVNSWLTQQEYEDIQSRYLEEGGALFTGHSKKDCRVKLLFPSRTADWTLQKKLYQGKSDNHNAVFARMSDGRENKRNFGYDNDLLYWPLNKRGYMTPGTIDTARMRGIKK